MPLKIEQDGEEVEVYTAAEVETQKAEAATAAATAKEAEFTPKLTEAEGKLTEAQRALATRTGEFVQFRKLNEEQLTKLTEAERINYENGLALKEANDARNAAEEKNKNDTVASVIRAKAGTNADLQKKMEEMWPLIGVEAATPEQIEQKALMVLGAISTTTPNLIAGVSGFTGNYAPPGPQNDGETKNYADTPEGKAAAAALGLKLEAPK